MTVLDPCEAAVARWLAHGVTSETHPVLRFALDAFFAPVGIEARTIEAEPFGALESGLTHWWLQEPAWNPALVDRGAEAAKDFGYLLEAPQSFRITVASEGSISILRLSSDLAAEVDWGWDWLWSRDSWNCTAAASGRPAPAWAREPS